MNWMVEVMRGMTVGVAAILPGVSGGAMLVALGAYEQVIASINGLTSDFRRSLRALWPYALGMALGALILARVIAQLLYRYPVPTGMAFSGLILGGLPLLIRRARDSHPGAVGIVAALVMAALSIGGAVLRGGVADVALHTGAGAATALFGVGLIAAVTLVIPRISGSVLLMLLGYYGPILAAVGEAADALASGRWGELMHISGLLLPFALGIGVGALLLARLVEGLLKRWPGPCHCAMLGLTAAAPAVILLELNPAGTTIMEALVGLEAAIWGFAVAHELGEGE